MLTRFFYILDILTTAITVTPRLLSLPKEDNVDSARNWSALEKQEHSKFHLDQRQLQLPMVPRTLRSK